MAIILTGTHKDILEFAKETSFHGTLKEFCDKYGVSREEAEKCVSELRKKRIIVGPPDMWNSWISVTNYGWNIMGWK